MRATGIVRRIDDLGRIVLPKEIRKNYDIDNDTVVEWAINDNGNPEINFRKKRNFKNLGGAFKSDERTNAVELKRSLYE